MAREMYTLHRMLLRVQGGGVASGGMRELIPTVARTAVAAGVDGIFMEVRSCTPAIPIPGQ